MPPNLGGFFMVRSYYPSECHADYFDFERIEALKPAIEACGISTLSQSPMLGFHKQMDNRIKLLEEILSFRMQGVEFDNGDIYVDGHKAASDVRDEFVSVTEKLMDELAQCYNVLPQLEDKLCLIFKLAPSVCRMTFPILASLLVRLVVLLPFQLLRLSLATPSRWTPLALSVFLHCVVALLLTLL